MEGFCVSSSIQRPADDDAETFRYPSWVLLDSRAHFADLDNATTVKAKASTGHEVQVTFCLAEPPAVSYFCVRCPEDCRTTEPRVVSSANELVLLCFAFRTGPPSREEDCHLLEYFVYKAASGGNQSIRPVPSSSSTYRHSWHAAILPCEGDDFLIADLVRNGDLGHYDLLIFSSEMNEWSATHLQLQTPPDVVPRNLPSQTDKVISLGGSTVGWVDLWRGIVVCDVLHKDPVLRFIPLPKGDFDGQARLVRDVMGFPNGLISFIEVENCSKWYNFSNMRSFKTTSFLDFLDTIQDTELGSHDERVVMDDGLKSVPDGWKIRTCFRSISSDHWRKRHVAHVDDISTDQRHSLLELRLWDSRARKCILRNLNTTAGIPTFSIYDDNAVYLKVASRDDEDAWIIGVDLGKKTLEVIKPYCAVGSTSFDPTFISCAFSEYLNTTPSPRPCVDESAANYAQNVVPNDHLSSGGAIREADCAQNSMSNDHVSSGDTVPNNVQPQQNTWNGDSYHGSWNEYDYGAPSGYYGNYQQPTPFQPWFIPPPSFTQTVRPMSSPIQLEGYIYPLSKMDKPTLIVPPLAQSMHPMAAQPPFAQPLAPRQFFAPR
ncbi:hypothetical protein VPH35_026585 [Triticum aestivum]